MSRQVSYWRAFLIPALLVGVLSAAAIAWDETRPIVAYSDKGHFPIRSDQLPERIRLPVAIVNLPGAIVQLVLGLLLFGRGSDPESGGAAAWTLAIVSSAEFWGLVGIGVEARMAKRKARSAPAAY